MKNITHRLRRVAALFGAAVFASAAPTPVLAASAYPEHILLFKDMHVIDGETPAFFWSNERFVVINAETTQRYSATPSSAYVATYDFKSDRLAVLAEHARVVCLLPKLGFGVLEKGIYHPWEPGVEAGQASRYSYLRLKVEKDGHVIVTTDPASAADCLSVQHNKDWGSQPVVDLGPGNGVLLGGNNTLGGGDPKIQSEHISYVTEQGERIDFPYSSRLMGNRYVPSRDVWYVGFSGENRLVMNKFGKIWEEPVTEKQLKRFFSSYWPLATPDGFIVFASGKGVTKKGIFYYQQGSDTPVRIYESKGYGDESGGAAAVSPDGCIFITTLTVDAFVNRYLTLSPSDIKTRLHYANICAAFGK